MCEVCAQYDRVRVSDVAVAKILGVSEVAQIARAEGRLRRFLLKAWEVRAEKAAQLGGELAGQGKTAAQIAAAVRGEMARWEKEALPKLQAAVEEIYRLARTAAWKKATGQTRAGLDYSTPNLTEVLKAKPKKGFTVKPALGVVDNDAVDALQKQQVFWVGDHYDKNIASAVRVGAREALVEAGESRRAAARGVYRRLKGELAQVNTPKGWNGSAAQYFEGLAANAATQGRVHGQLVSFAETGFTTYTIVNPQDQRTCPVCSSMNGRTFTVAQGQQTMGNVLAAEGPDDVRAAHPWKDPETGRRMTVAGVDRIAGGRDAKASEELSKAGFNLPPFHFRCRCTVDVDPGGPPAAIDAPPPVPPKPEGAPRPPRRPALLPPTPGKINTTALVDREKDLASFMIDGEDASFMGKGPLQAIAAKLERDETFRRFAVALSESDEAAMLSTTQVGHLLEDLSETKIRKLVEDATRKLRNTWNRTSGDSSNMAVAMQNAANAEFELGAATAHFKPVALEGAAKEFAAKGWTPALQRFLRVQYELTQETLKKQGIKELFVTRGMTWHKTLVPKGVKATGKATKASFAHQPMSSYTTDADQAAAFASGASPASVNAVAGTTAPAERILALGGHGMGAAGESEVVLLGTADDAVRIVAWEKAAAGDLADSKAVYNALKEGVQ